MIETKTKNRKSSKGIRGFLIYWILGVIYIEIAILLVFFPIDDAVKYSVLFGFITIITGVFVIIFSRINRRTLITSNWHFVSGIIDVLFGIFLIAYLFKTIIALPYIIAFWIIIRSCHSLGFSMDMVRLNVYQWQGYHLFNILAVISSVALLCFPQMSILTIIYTIDFAFLCMGVVRIMHALEIRKLYYS